MSSPAESERTYDGPEPPVQGQTYVDTDGGFWRVQRLTVAEHPRGFYLVHLAYGPSINGLQSSMVVGPREFAALIRDRDLRAHLHSV